MSCSGESNGCLANLQRFGTSGRLWKRPKQPHLWIFSVVTAILALLIFIGIFHWTVSPQTRRFARMCFVWRDALVRNDSEKFEFKNYKRGLCTHLIYYAVRITSDSPWNETVDADLVKAMQELRKSVDPDVKLLLAFSQYWIEDISETDWLLSTVLEMVHSRNFDGIHFNYDQLDLDVIPFLPSRKARIIDEFNDFIFRLRRSSPRGMLLTITIPAWGQGRFFDVIYLEKHVDFILVQTYEMENDFYIENATQIQSPLFSHLETLKTDCNRTMLNYAEIVPREKLIMGLAIFGKGWFLAKPTDIGLGAPTTGVPNATRLAPGLRVYFELCAMLDAGARRSWDDLSKCPYMVFGDQWYGYDDIQSLGYKLDFVRNGSFGGVYAHSLDFDDFNTFCNSSATSFPLAEMIRSKLDLSFTPLKSDAEKEREIVVISVVIVVSVVFLLIGIIATLCFKKRQIELRERESDVVKMQYEAVRVSVERALSGYKILAERLGPPLQLLGQGNFGRVTKRLLVNDDGEGGVFVAAKEIRRINLRNCCDLLNETVLMHELRHPNVVPFLGYCFEGRQERPVLVTKFMAGGSLLLHLKTLNDQKPELKTELIRLCKEAAAGMLYLHQKHIVHRDLAARNCMLDGRRTLLINDFDLSRRFSTYTAGYKVDLDRSKFPIAWTPPEVLEGRAFTTAGDVWSYGVLVWEIFTLGATPYKDDFRGAPSREDMARLLAEGRRLGRPTLCDEEIYLVIVKHCWNAEPEQRWSFHELCGFTRKALSNLQAAVP